MSEFDPAVKAALDRIQPLTPAPPDWANVLARRRRRRACIVLVGIVLATAAMLALAAPPLSLGERLFVTENERPVPERVKEHFRWGNEARQQRPTLIEWDRPPSGMPHVEVDRSRSVLTLETRRGNAVLFAAPAEGDRTCFIVQRTWEMDGVEGPLESSCTSDPARPLEVHDVSSVRRRGDWLLAGFVRDGLELELEPEDGVRVGFADGFFVAELSSAADMIDVLARSGGEVVVRERLRRPSMTPFERPPPEAFRLATIVDVAPGVPFGLGVATTPETVCLAYFLGEQQRAFFAGRVGELASCGRPPAGRDVHWEIEEEEVYGAAPQPPTPVAVLYGVATRRVDSLEIRYEDGKRQPVKSNRKPLGFFDRYFVFSIPRAHFARGHVPRTLVGRDTSGRILFSDRLG